MSQVSEQTSALATQDELSSDDLNSLSAAYTETVGKENPDTYSAIDKSNPLIKQLEYDICVRAKWITQQIEELADKAGVKAEVLFKVLLNPK